MAATYEAATPEEVALALQAIRDTGDVPTGFAYNPAWHPDPIKRVVVGPAPEPPWTPEGLYLDSRMDELELNSGLSKTVADTLYPDKTVTETALTHMYPGRMGSVGDTLGLGPDGVPDWIPSIEYRVTHPRFGAVGDGATDYTAETAAFQAAITAAAPAKRWVVVPPGTYDLGMLDVTTTLYLRLEPGAVIRKRGGSHSESLFNFTGDRLVIRGDGILSTIDGNRHNNPGRPAMISGTCEQGKVIDVEGVHFTSFMQGARINQFGGYVNFSHLIITDQGQHQQVSGATTTIVTINSGQIGAVSPYIRTDFNWARNDEEPITPGTAPGGFFVCTSDQPTTPLEQGNLASWQAIGNYFYGYGQNHSTNEIGCLHTYPSPAQVRWIANDFEHFYITPMSAKSVTDFTCLGNTFTDGVTNDAYVPHAGTILYAPGYHAGALERLRAVIANNIGSNAGGTASQGAYGIVVNATADSIAQDVVISGNDIAVRGVPLMLSWVKDAHGGDNIFKTLSGVSAVKRGIVLSNIQGDITLDDTTVDTTSDAGGIGIAAVDATNALARLFLNGGLVKTDGAACIDARGVEMLKLSGGLTVERGGGGAAINVTANATPTPVGTLIYDRSVTILEGDPAFDHANIVSFVGQEPLGGTPGGSTGAAAGTGASITVTGDGDKGVIALTTGTGPTTGGVATITFADPRRAAPVVLFAPANSAAAVAFARIYASTVTENLFVISVISSALTASTTYQWRYRLD